MEENNNESFIPQEEALESNIPSPSESENSTVLEDKNEPFSLRRVVLVAIVIVLLFSIYAAFLVSSKVDEYKNGGSYAESQETLDEFAELKKEETAETKNTHRYNNETYGIAFNYPENWSVVTEDTELDFFVGVDDLEMVPQEPTEYRPAFWMSAQPTNLTTNDGWLEAHVSVDDPLRPTFQTIDINGRQALMLDDPVSPDGCYMVLVHNAMEYSFSCNKDIYDSLVISDMVSLLDGGNYKIAPYPKLFPKTFPDEGTVSFYASENAYLNGIPATISVKEHTFTSEKDLRMIATDATSPSIGESVWTQDVGKNTFVIHNEIIDEDMEVYVFTTELTPGRYLEISAPTNIAKTDDFLLLLRSIENKM